MLQQRRALQIAGRDLVRRDVELPQEIGARQVERGREEVDAELARVRLQLAVLLEAELEELAMLAVGRAEAVLVVVRLVVRRARVEAAVVALLQLDRMRARELRLAEQLARLLEAALVVVADLGDDVALRVVADLVRADPECPCQCVLPAFGAP